MTDDKVTGLLIARQRNRLHNGYRSLHLVHDEHPNSLSRRRTRAGFRLYLASFPTLLFLHLFFERC